MRAGKTNRRGVATRRLRILYFPEGTNLELRNSGTSLKLLQKMKVVNPFRPQNQVVWILHPPFVPEFQCSRLNPIFLLFICSCFPDIHIQKLVIDSLESLPELATTRLVRE
jgi:hypothetical protein